MGTLAGRHSWAIFWRSFSDDARIDAAHWCGYNGLLGLVLLAP
jgi:hypothetical protein